MSDDIKVAAIPVKWTHAVNSWLARDLLLLLDEVNRRGIDHKDIPAVKAVWDELRSKDNPMPGEAKP